MSTIRPTALPDATRGARDRAAGAQRWARQIVERALPSMAADICRGGRFSADTIPHESLEATLLMLVVADWLSQRAPRGRLAGVLRTIARPAATAKSRDRDGASHPWPRLRAELDRLGLPAWPTRSDAQRADAAWPFCDLSAECLSELIALIRSAGDREVAGSTLRSAGQSSLSAESYVSMLGALRQTLLEYELIAPQLAAPPSAADQTPAAWQATRSLARRRGTGSYYTPFPLRRWLVQRTLAPAWRAWLRATATSDSDSPPPRVLDPAMGAGHFLVSAHQWLARQLRKLASEAPHHPAVATANGRYERFVLAHCLWGTDSDAVTVAAARVGLWLAAGAPSQTTGFERLQLADALVEPVIEPSGFDVVLGNPPYGKPADRAYRSVVRKRFAGTRHNADLSVAFVALAREALRPAGRVGLVLPKPLSYSAAWRRLRREITPEVVALCDVECGWREVRLEQMLLVLSPHARRAGYATARADGTRFVRGPRCAVSLATRLDTLPAGADVRDWRRFDRLRCGRQSFGDVCRTFRGLPAQRQLRAAGEIAVLGGRDLVPFGVRSTSGYLAAAEVPAELTNGPRLLFQNIVAHVQRPRPHLRLIGTWHAGQLATLDTVNNVVDRRDEVDLWAVLALLQSQLVNWYVYTFVYNRAVRTMHFDQYFLDKIPLPERLDDYAAALAAAARRATEITAARPAAVGYDRTLSSAIPARGTSGRSDTADALQIELRLVNHDIESLTRAAYGLR